MKPIIKNILIAVFVPSVLAVGYFGYKYYTRKQKEKKILDEVQKHLDKNKKLLTGMDKQVIAQWKTELSKLKIREFESFFKYFMETIPVGKVSVTDKDDASKTHEVWISENTNPVQFKLVAEEGLKAMSGKEIEKLFNAIIL